MFFFIFKSLLFKSFPRKDPLWCGYKQNKAGSIEVESPPLSLMLWPILQSTNESRAAMQDHDL